MDAAARIGFLDGIRGLAVLLVLVHHFVWIRREGLGFIGVNTFFVLSGFIITHLLLREFARERRLAIGHFLLRRGFRLLPALIAFLIAALAIHALHPAPHPDVPAQAAAALGQVYNWGVLGGWFSYSLVGHCWSLSIEGQFYLVYPLVLLLVLRLSAVPAHRMAAMAALAVLAWAAGLVHAWLHGDLIRLMRGTDFQALPLLVGGAIALAAPGALVPRHRPRLVGLADAAALAALLAWAVGWKFGPDRALAFQALHFPGATLAAGWLVFSQLRWPGGVTGWLLNRPELLWCGAISYSLYLWHPLVLSQLPNRHWSVLAAGMAAAILIAWVSWRMVELPCQRLRARFAHVAGAG